MQSLSSLKPCLAGVVMFKKEKGRVYYISVTNNAVSKSSNPNAKEILLLLSKGRSIHNYALRRTIIQNVGIIMQEAAF